MKPIEIKAYNLWGELDKCSSRDEEIVLIVKALKEQHRDTRHACAEACSATFEISGKGAFHSICMNVKAV